MTTEQDRQKVMTEDAVMSFSGFRQLVKDAAKESRHLSGGYEKHQHMHKLLQENVSTAWLCLMLEDDSIFQAFALLYAHIPEEDQPPIPDYYRGRIPVILECWRYWALQRKHVVIKYDPREYWVEDKDGNRGNWH